MKNFCFMLIILIASATHSYSDAVTIPDINLANAVRKALDLGPTDPIPQKELEELEQLIASQKSISDLTGLEEATGLMTLTLSGNQISDITPIAFLPHLTELNLTRNQISDLTPLAFLPQPNETIPRRESN